MEVRDWKEREYRNCDFNSFSSIKLFLEDRNKYYKKHILKQQIKEEDETTNEDLRIGSLVDCLLFTPENLEDKFVTTGSVVPKYQMMTFVQNLYRRTLLHTDSEGRLNRKLEDLIDDAYNDTKYDKNGELVAFKAKTVEKVKEDFVVKKIGYDYYLDLRNRADKFVITIQELDNAQKVANILKVHKYTKHIFNTNLEKKNQFILTGKYLGIDIKCMIDTVLIDPVRKEVFPYDLKTTWNVDRWEEDRYYKYKYYLQAALYTTMLRQYFTGYTVHPMSFIVVDKIGYRDPCIYKLSEEHINLGLTGFTKNGYSHPGLNPSLEDIKYHISTGVWTSPAEVQRNNGSKYLN